MARRLQNITTAIPIAAAVSSLPFPPLAGAIGFVPDGWSVAGGVVPEFDLMIRSEAVLDITLAEVWGGVLHALAFADNEVTSVDHTTDTFTKVAHGFQTGDGPVQLSNVGGAVPAGSATLTSYWIIKVTDDTYKLAETFELALAGTALALTGNGTGTHSVIDVATTMRVHYYSYGALTASIALTGQKSYRRTVAHRPGVVCYAVTGTLSANTVSIDALPVTEN
jgi:hypothetical protein